MALTPTIANSLAYTTSAAATASGSYAPAPNSLQIAIAGLTSNATPVAPLPATIGDTFSGGSLTWTQLGAGISTITGTNGSAIAAFWAIAGATPGSGVVTITFNEAHNRRGIAIVQVPLGFTTPTPIVQYKFGANNLSTLTVTLDAAPGANNLVLGAVITRIANAVANGADYTELLDLPISTNSALEVQYDNAGGAAAVDWSSFDGTTSRNSAVAIEIAEAVIAGGQPAMRRFGMSQFMRPVEMGRKGVRII